MPAAWRSGADGNPPGRQRGTLGRDATAGAEVGGDWTAVPDTEGFHDCRTRSFGDANRRKRRQVTSECVEKPWFAD